MAEATKKVSAVTPTLSAEKPAASDTPASQPVQAARDEVQTGEQQMSLQQEARKLAVERLTERGVDLEADPGNGWTIQQGARPDEAEPVPGYVVTEDELPDAEVQKAAGIDPEQHNAGLVIAATEDERYEIRHASRPANSMNEKDQSRI